MDAKLKEHLPQLTLETLSRLDRGRLARQFQRILSRTMVNISEFPIRGDKTEPRTISIELTLTPEVKFQKQGVETVMGHTEIDVPEIVGLNLTAKIKDKLPVFQTDDVRFAVDVVNGQIKDARFNPENNNNPAQLQLEYEDDPTNPEH